MAVTSANAKIASTGYVDDVQEKVLSDARVMAQNATADAKSYTNEKIGALDATTNGTGAVVTGVTQTDGVVTVTKGNIDYSDLTGTPTVDTAMSDSSANAVQNKVIKSYVDNAIDTVEGEIGEGYQKLDQKLTSTDDETRVVTPENRDLLYPSYAKAEAMVGAGVQSANAYIDQEIGALDSTAVATGTNDGKYATVVTQTDGKISTARVQFDSSISADSTALNAPTSLAVKTYVDDAIAGVNGDVSGKVSINQGQANKDKGLIVNASGALELADVATDAELEAVSDIVAQVKAGVSDINNSDVMKSGITSGKVAEITQNTTDIAAITGADEATEGSEDGRQYVLTKKVANGATTYSWELIDRALAN